MAAQIALSPVRRSTIQLRPGALVALFLSVKSCLHQIANFPRGPFCLLVVKHWAIPTAADRLNEMRPSLYGMYVF